MEAGRQAATHVGHMHAHITSTSFHLEYYYFNTVGTAASIMSTTGAMGQSGISSMHKNFTRYSTA